MRSRILRAALGGALLGVCAFLACTGETTTEFPPSDAPASGTITAATGGVIRTGGGIVLDVPPGAVTSDVEVTVYPLDATSLNDPSAPIGARFAPDGLVLKKPATLRLPLAGRDAPPLELPFRGSDPNAAIESGEPVSYDGADATLQVWHFSGKVCAVNCHGGTREFLAAQLAKKGIDLAACVTQKYGAGALPTKCDDLHSELAVQKILNTFFDELPSCCDAGQDVSQGQLEKMLEALAHGRNVVLAFDTGFGAKSGGFYPHVAHTAAVEVIGGTAMIRNTVVVPKNSTSDILQMIGGTNVVYGQLGKVNDFRELQSGVALEIAACGTPGCLDQDHGGPFAKLENRQKPYRAVRIFIEREGTPDCSPVDGGTDGGLPDGGTTDAAEEDAAQCPSDYPLINGFCAGQSGCDGEANGGACPCEGEFCCPENFCWSRETVACEQIQCPPGAGRTYTLECCCDCWDDKSKVNVYDPCQPGHLLRCDPRM